MFIIFVEHTDNQPEVSSVKTSNIVFENGIAVFTCEARNIEYKIACKDIQEIED